MDEEILYDDYEVYNKHKSKHFHDYRDALNYAKVSTQFEDVNQVNQVAYIIRKTKIRGQEKTCYIESVTWIEDNVWLFRDLM